MQIRHKCCRNIVYIFQRFSSSNVKITINHKSFSDERKTILNYTKSSLAIRRINWENNCLFGPLTTRKTHKKIETATIPNSSIANNSICPSFPFDEEIKCILYFENLNASNFICKDKYITPSDNFDMNYALNFPMLNIESSKKYQGISYLSELKNYNFPSVTYILNQTMSPANLAVLQKWKMKMIAELGEEGFKKYQRDIIDNGSSLHRCIEDYLLGIPESQLNIKEGNLGHWNSLKTVIPYIENVKILEKPVSHPYLMYKGIIDCVATFRNQLVIIDWKTSKRHKRTFSSTYDNPIQLAAYVGALNFDTTHDIKVDSAVIIIAYENGDPAEVHYMPPSLCCIYWKEWLKRLKHYWHIINKK